MRTADGSNAKRPRRGPCYYGDLCYNVACAFEHPSGESRAGLSGGSGTVSTIPRSPFPDLNGVCNLHVTPELQVPAARLPTQPLGGVMTKWALDESAKGLVDAGGMFNFSQDATVLERVHPHGFIAAATAAFQHHYPLSIRPQHFCLMILQAAAKHVEQNAEELRPKWVAHEGKPTLEVECPEFILGARNNWASTVDGKPDCFSTQIDKNVVEGLAKELSPAFSETSEVENIALKITVMDITKSFFRFSCATKCGFPYVIMEGTAEDWQLLRRNAELLIKNRCQQKFAEEWCAALLPVLDMFVQEYTKGVTGEGMPDEQFWNSMCKRGGTKGSGSRTWFNGWINIFFPYIMDCPNQYMIPYSRKNGYVKEGRNGYEREGKAAKGKGKAATGKGKADVQGPDCSDFPGGLAAAPVVWNYYGTKIELKFKAGFVGAEQDPATGAIKPVVGWFIAHDEGERKRKAAKGTFFRECILSEGKAAKGKGKAPPSAKGKAKGTWKGKGKAARPPAFHHKTMKNWAAK